LDWLITQTKREAPEVCSRARKRVVSRDNQDRGLKDRYIDAERFFHSFFDPLHGDARKNRRL